MKRKAVTPEKLARIDAWFAAWSKPRKVVAWELGISWKTLMDAAYRKGAYARIPKATP